MNDWMNVQHLEGLWISFLQIELFLHTHMINILARCGDVNEQFEN